MVLINVHAAQIDPAYEIEKTSRKKELATKCKKKYCF
jgi:hypothetical protein